MKLTPKSSTTLMLIAGFERPDGPLVWLHAQLFFRYRQMRWRRLARMPA